jgi:hypothetical protein
LGASPQVLREPSEVKSSNGPRVVTQGPCKSALSLGEFETTSRGVQVRSTTRCGTCQVRYDSRATVSTELDGHPQQLTLGDSFTTTDTGTDRARGLKIVVGSHQQVSLAGLGPERRTDSTLGRVRPTHLRPVLLRRT